MQEGEVREAAVYCVVEGGAWGLLCRSLGVGIGGFRVQGLHFYQVVRRVVQHLELEHLGLDLQEVLRPVLLNPYPIRQLYR